MIRKTLFAVATVAAIGAAALIPTEASAGGGGKGGGKGGGHHGHWGHGYGGGGFGSIVVDRTQLLAMGPRPRQGVCLLLIDRYRLVSADAKAPVSRRETGAYPFTKRAERCPT
jgi:hypothetical protein